VRREGLDALKGAKESASEDDVRRNSKVIEAMTEELVKKCTDMLEQKKKEIMTV
jgi:ribosome recycling factor